MPESLQAAIVNTNSRYMDEDGDIYENCAPSYETPISTTAFNNREEERTGENVKDSVSSRYIAAPGRRLDVNRRAQDENLGAKQLPPSDSSRKQAASFTTKVIPIILVVTTLVNTAMCAWIMVSFQNASLKRETSRHRAASSSANSSRIGHDTAALQNLSLVVDRMTKSIAQSQLRNRNELQNLWSELNRVAASQRRSYSDISTRLGVIASSIERTQDELRNTSDSISGSLSALSKQLIVSLVNGPNPSSGRVEIYYRGEWGTICDDEWDINDARVICRMLGYHEASLAPQNAHYGEGSGKILLDDVHCQGTEVSIADCLKRPWGMEDCSHSEDASVVCSS